MPMTTRNAPGILRTPHRRIPRLPAAFAALAALSLLGACGGEDATAEAAWAPVHVDSIFPIEEEIRRFREGMTPVSELSGGLDSPAALVDALLRRVEAADTLGVAELALTRTEFAYLYYPFTMYTAPPYELSPALVWFQQQNRSSRGLGRLLRDYAGKPLYDTGFSCPDGGEPFGEGRIWHGCTVLGELPGGEQVEERLFGSILEVGGRHKFVSFSNEL